MVSLDAENLLDARVGWHDGKMSVAFLNAGEVLTGDFPYRSDQTDELNVAILSPVTFDGLTAMFAMTVPDYSSLYDRTHFELIISNSPNVVISGVVDESLVLMRYHSEETAGWYIEMGTVYNFPSAGATSESYSGWIPPTVKKVVANLDLDPSQPIYACWRSRRYNSGTHIYTGDFSGAETYTKNSVPGYTGSMTTSNQIVPINFGDVTWPTGKSAHFEVYIGQKPLGYGGYSLVSRDSSSNNSGFRYFDGSDMSIIPTTGVPNANFEDTRFLITNPIPSDKLLYVSYRAKWDAVASPWATSIFMPLDTYTDVGQTYTPGRTIEVSAGDLPSDYHVQVIAGLSNDLRDYFPGGDITLSEPNLSYALLFEYSYSYDISQRDRFVYYDDVFKSPNYEGFPVAKDLLISYTSSLPYGMLDDMYVFWRFVHAPAYSSSSSSSNNSLSSSSSSSSDSLSSSTSTSNSTSSSATV